MFKIVVNPKNLIQAIKSINFKLDKKASCKPILESIKISASSISHIKQNLEFLNLAKVATVIIEEVEGFHYTIQPYTIDDSVSYGINFISQPLAEYPAINFESIEADYIVIKGKVLSNLIESVLYATSKEESRYNLNGIFLNYDDSDLTFKAAAADGHRLAIQETTSFYLDSYFSSFTCIVHKDHLKEVLKMIDSESSYRLQVRSTYNDHKSLFISGAGMQASLEVLEGQFPDYKRVVPAIWDKKAIIDKKSTLKALKKIGKMASARFNTVKMTFNGALKLYHCNPDKGEVSLSVDLIEKLNGEELIIGAQLPYLMDALSNVNSDEVECMMTDEVSAILMSDGLNHTAVLMPVQL
jgi:DNA polymerase-3 subunit beta